MLLKPPMTSTGGRERGGGARRRTTMERMRMSPFLGRLHATQVTCLSLSCPLFSLPGLKVELHPDRPQGCDGQAREVIARVLRGENGETVTNTNTISSATVFLRPSVGALCDCRRFFGTHREGQRGMYLRDRENANIGTMPCRRVNVWFV